MGVGVRGIKNKRGQRGEEGKINIQWQEWKKSKRGGELNGDCGVEGNSRAEGEARSENRKDRRRYGRDGGQGRVTNPFAELRCFS